MPCIIPLFDSSHVDPGTLQDNVRCHAATFCSVAFCFRKPNFAGWANDIRLMRERDGRNHRDMCVLFRWACQDNFWSGNVLSPAKLRDKWTQLEINRNKQQAGVTAGKSKLDLTNTDWIYGVDL